MVTPDLVRFYVNGQLVAMEERKEVPADGIAGVRINHNLHEVLTPATLK